MLFKLFRNLLSLFILFADINITYTQSSQIDIISYEVKAWYNKEKKLLDIASNIKINNKTNLKTFKLLLSPYASIQTMHSENSVIEFSRIPKDTLLITCPELIAKKKILNLSLQYALPIDSFIFNEVVMLRRETRWYPLQYDDIASMQVDISAPNDHIVLMSADLTTKITNSLNTQYSFKNNKSHSYSIIITETNTFKITQTQKLNDVILNFYFASDDTATCNKIINEVCRSFSFYNEYIGQYQRKELSIVEIPDNRVQMVQSLSNLIMVGTPFINYYKLGYSNWPSHEMAHQWWGCGVYINSQTKGRWFLEESIAEYLSALYVKSTFGVSQFEKQIKGYFEVYKEVEDSKELPIFEIKNLFTKENGYVIYQKGPLIINKLKNSMSEGPWWDFIQELYNSYYGQLLNYDDFTKPLSKYKKQEDLENLLNKLLSETSYIE